MLTAKCFFPLVCVLLNVLNVVNFGIFDRGRGSNFFASCQIDCRRVTIW